MIKIAVELKQKNKDSILERLKMFGYNVDTNSFMSIWIYDLKNIRFGKDSIILENGTFHSFKLELKDLDYFEIHSQKEV